MNPSCFPSSRTTPLRSALCAAVLACAAAPAPAQVGVSVNVAQPGVYGRIDIGNVPPPAPALVYAQPILVQPPPRVATAPPRPVYLWVPPGHQRNWRKHCHRYDACGVPVYFVQERWVREHARGHGHGHGHGRGHGRGD